MLIVDAHVHIGKCNIYNEIQTEEDVIKTMNENKIDVSIVQPLPGVIDHIEIHNRIAKMAKKYPGRIFGMASLNPHIDEEKYKMEIRRCIKELGFVAIKLHPQAYACDILSPDADKVFKLADELSVPVMLHTGRGIPFANPAASILRAREYPNLTIVLAHSGFCMTSTDALVAAKICDNIFLETSWTIPPDIIRFVKELGSEKVMFATDSILNVKTELAKYRSLNFTQKELEDCLGKNAQKLFKLSN